MMDVTVEDEDDMIRLCIQYLELRYVTVHPNPHIPASEPDLH